jgi:nitroreductase
MMLAAWAEGITSCPTSMYDMEEARGVLGIPEGYRIAIVLAFAYPPASGIKSRGLTRLPLEEVVHRGGW